MISERFDCKEIDFGTYAELSTGMIEGKRSRGRQRTTFIESLDSWAEQLGSKNDLIRLTENRFEWRAVHDRQCLFQTRYLKKKKKQSLVMDRGLDE